MDNETNNKNAYFLRKYKNVDHRSNGPLVELGAIYKILDFITDSDPKISSLTSNCCNEISKILQCLLVYRCDKNLHDLLISDPSLHKCEYCGVISHSLKPHSERVKANSVKVTRNADIMAVKRDLIDNEQDNEKLQVLPSSLKKEHLQLGKCVNVIKINRRTRHADKLNRTGSLPVKERDSVMKNCIGNQSDANNIFETEADIGIGIKYRSQLDNNAIKKLFTKKNAKTKRRYQSNRVVRNRHNYECSTATKANIDSNEEEVVRKISYESKFQNDNNTLTKNCLAKSTQKCPDSYPIMDTVKYLTRRRFATLDKKQNESSPKLQEKHYEYVGDTKRRHHSIDDRPERDTGFWLFDESGRLPHPILNEHQNILQSRLKNNGDNNCYTNISQQINNVKNSDRTNSQIDFIEKDSLEDCILPKQRKTSDSTTTSSSTVISYEWMADRKRKEKLNKDINKDFSKNRKLLSSRSSSDISQSIRHGITRNKYTDNVERTICKQQVHKSNTFVRLSPRTRSKIYCFIQRMVLPDSVTDSKSRKKYSTSNNTTYYSKSTNNAFKHANSTLKLNKEIPDISINHRIPIKLTELPKNKNRSHIERDVIGELQNFDKFKNNLSLFHKNTMPFVGFDKLKKTEFPYRSSEGKITQRIMYKDVKDIIDDSTEILPMYRKILENNKNTDWETFRALVEMLHPDQKKLWCDICKTINEQAKKVTDDNIEVYIEISPIIAKRALKMNKITTSSHEIVFELDMTLNNIENFL